MTHKRLLAILITLASVCPQLSVKAQTIVDGGKNIIRLNQVGFFPGAGKIAVITVPQTGKFYIKTINGKTVFSGELKASGLPAFSGNYTAIADFSALNKPGSYALNLPGKGASYPFEIKPNALKTVADGTIKAFYYQRASIALDEKYAGKWHRAAGHPDNKVLIHPSAATEQRPEGTIVSSPRGWYDAGDYNKYIVNSGVYENGKTEYPRK